MKPFHLVELELHVTSITDIVNNHTFVIFFESISIAESRHVIIGDLYECVFSMFGSVYLFDQVGNSVCECVFSLLTSCCTIRPLCLSVMVCMQSVIL